MCGNPDSDQTQHICKAFIGQGVGKIGQWMRRLARTLVHGSHPHNHRSQWLQSCPCMSLGDQECGTTVERIVKNILLKTGLIRDRSGGIAQVSALNIPMPPNLTLSFGSDQTRNTFFCDNHWRVGFSILYAGHF